MQFNLLGIGRFQNDMESFVCYRSLPISARIISLPTSAVFRAIQSIFDNMCETVLFGVAGVINFNAQALSASAKCALSIVIDPIALLVLGVACPFMSLAGCKELINNIGKTYDNFEKPPATFGALTGRVIVILIGVTNIIKISVKTISKTAIPIIHKLGECLGIIVERTILLGLGIVAKSLGMVKRLFSFENCENEIYKKSFSRPSGEIPDSDNEIDVSESE